MALGFALLGSTYASDSPKRADTCHALRTCGMRALEVIRSDAAERIDRQARIGDPFGKTLPAEWLCVGVGCGGANRRQRGEVRVHLRSAFQFLRVMARRTDPRPAWQRPLVQLAQLRGFEMHA